MVKDLPIASEFVRPKFYRITMYTPRPKRMPVTLVPSVTGSRLSRFTPIKYGMLLDHGTAEVDLRVKAISGNRPGVTLSRFLRGRQPVRRRLCGENGLVVKGLRLWTPRLSFRALDSSY